MNKFATICVFREVKNILTAYIVQQLKVTCLILGVFAIGLNL